MITRQAKMVFSAYRRDEFSDPDGFVLQLGMVLEAYDDAVIEYVTSPRTGIQRRSKWPPSIAEVVDACDAEIARQATLARYAAMPKPRSHVALPPDRRDGRRASVFVHADDLMYARMVTMSETADKADWKLDEAGRAGIWVPLGWLHQTAPKVAKTWKAPTDAELMNRYGAATAADVDLSEAQNRSHCGLGF